MGKTKSKLTKKELNYFKKLVLKKREDLMKELGYLRETAMSSTIKESSGDHSSYSFHMADQGTDSMEREKAFLFVSREGHYLEHLNQALARIEEGTFGICFKCGKLISKERLKAVPITTQCVDCKKKSV
jgi:RNA polymerase-binding protein DksA